MSDLMNVTPPPATEESLGIEEVKIPIPKKGNDSSLLSRTAESNANKLINGTDAKIVELENAVNADNDTRLSAEDAALNVKNRANRGPGFKQNYAVKPITPKS